MEQTKNIETPAVIQLSEEDSNALRDAGRAKRRAATEAVNAKARLDDASLRYMEIFERLAEQHNFDEGARLRFDHRQHTLTFPPPTVERNEPTDPETPATTGTEG